MLANELIDQLERRGLLDQEIIEALREQLDSGGARVTPEAVAKLLVDNGQLTRFQATKLIGELRSGEYSGDAEVVEVNAVDDLGIADEMGVAEVVEVVEEAVPVQAVEPVAVEAVAVEAVAVEAVPVEAVAVEAMPVGGMDSSGVMGGVEEDGEPAERPQSRVQRPDPDKSTWDSFKIYGYLGIIGFLLLAGGGLYFLLTRASADDYIRLGDKLYDQQNYTGAQERYQEFLDMFGESNQYSSIARTRIGMSELFRSEGMSDPTKGLDKCQEVLPNLAKEEGLNEERNNLAGLLVKMAENIAGAADEATETDEKQRLLGKLQQQIDLTQDGNYMTGSLRTALAGRLAAIEESRKRVERDINRNKRLDEAVTSMTGLLDGEDTKGAYDVRTELLRDFPELSSNERLTKLIERASQIQKDLVKRAIKLPENAPPGELQEPSTMVLTARSGNTSPDLRDEALFLRTKGSVLAFNGEDGTLLWRRFVGYQQNHTPVRLDGGIGVLLSESSKSELQRCGGLDGDVQWRAQIGEPFNQPVISRDDIYVTTEQGRLISLDAINGEANWATQVPQGLQVGPGIDGRAKRAYQPGDHSNLYVLDTQSGKCSESYYLGHKSGTISVPPVPLLGHLFVIENKGNDYCLIHILAVDENGDGVRKAQDPVRMDGNVIVSPIITQQRRIIVLTDLGQVSVFDVEPTATNEQVTEVAKQVASYESPTLTQMAVGKSQMWITGTRVGRYELQINKARVVPDWFKHEGDTFIGQPYASDETLVHARILRGTSSVRVTAVDPRSGEEIWRNDIGAPVVMLTESDDGYHVVNSQGALFRLDRPETGKVWGNEISDPPLENRGSRGITMRFANPMPIDAGRQLLLNQIAGQQTIVYDPSRPKEKLRLVNLNLPEGEPSGGGCVAGGGVFLPLDSGRAVVMNFLTGAPLGSPFQPVSNPVGKVTWTNPVITPDDPDQVVVADSRKGIYRLRVGDRINDLASETLESPLLGTLAGVGNSVVGATAGPAADFVVGYDIADLKPTFRVLLDSRVSWGPQPAGDVALVITADGMLHGITEKGQVKFSVPVPAGVPVGKPIEFRSRWIVAGKPGWILVLNTQEGKLLWQTELGQPLSATPVSLSDRVLAPGEEGVVYEVKFSSN